MRSIRHSIGYLVTVSAILLTNPCLRKAVWKWSSSGGTDVKEQESSSSMSTPYNDPYETKKLRILSVTWNMHGKKPPKDIENLLRLKDISHDVYVIGSQECIRSIAKSMFRPSKEIWEK